MTYDYHSYYRNEGKGGAIFFTCINPDEPLGEYVVTKPDICDDSSPEEEYLNCIEAQEQNGDNIEGVDISASTDTTRCELNIQDNKWLDNKAEVENVDIYWTNKNLTSIIDE